MLSWISLIISIAAVAISATAVTTNRYFETRQALHQLLERFGAAGFHVVTWRMEQYTREPLNEDPPDWSLEGVEIDDRKALLEPDCRHLFEQALGSDQSVLRADMSDVYFFALQVHAWLSPHGVRWGRVGRWLTRRKTRLLNDTFGYQLLTTFLDHWIVANRLRRTKARHPSYYAEQYGFFDDAYRELVELLYEDLHARSGLHKEIRRAIDTRWESLQRDGFRSPAPSPAAGSTV